MKDFQRKVSEAKPEKIALRMSLDEAQLIFDVLGDARLPINTRRTVTAVYRRLERLDFIADDDIRRR